MANKDYNFQYTPLTGRLPGNSFVKQTEQAINELAGIVNEGSAQVEVITNLANQANDNSEVALEKATEALETSSRVYITLPNLDDADDYFDSQLYYFANSHSANLPVEDTGFLEVKTNDTKTAAEQVFTADTTGLMYMRHGVITSEEVGSETAYSVTWETWSSELASQDYVQQEVNNEADRADATFLPLSGGTMTGSITLKNTTLVANRDVTDSWTVLLGGTTDTDGAYLRVDGSTSSSAGRFTLKATDGTNSSYLVGKPDGTLEWAGIWVERVRAGGTYYIRFESGVQIVWGSVGASTAGTTVTFPVAFANKTYAIIPQSSGTSLTAGYSSKTTTSVVIESSHQTLQATVDYICIGRWK